MDSVTIKQEPEEEQNDESSRHVGTVDLERQDSPSEWANKKRKRMKESEVVEINTSTATGNSVMSCDLQKLKLQQTELKQEVDSLRQTVLHELELVKKENSVLKQEIVHIKRILEKHVKEQVQLPHSSHMSATSTRAMPPCNTDASLDTYDDVVMVDESTMDPTRGGQRSPLDQSKIDQLQAKVQRLQATIHTLKKSALPSISSETRDFLWWILATARDKDQKENRELRNADVEIQRSVTEIHELDEERTQNSNSPLEMGPRSRHKQKHPQEEIEDSCAVSQWPPFADPIADESSYERQSLDSGEGSNVLDCSRDLMYAGPKETGLCRDDIYVNGQRDLSVLDSGTFDRSGVSLYSGNSGDQQVEQENLVELWPHTRVYIDQRTLQNCLHTSRNCASNLFHALVKYFFEPQQLATSVPFGGAAKPPEKNILPENVVRAIEGYVLSIASQPGWRSWTQHQLRKAFSNKCTQARRALEDQQLLQQINTTGHNPPGRLQSSTTGDATLPGEKCT